MVRGSALRRCLPASGRALVAAGLLTAGLVAASPGLAAPTTAPALPAGSSAGAAPASSAAGSDTGGADSDTSGSAPAGTSTKEGSYRSYNVMIGPNVGGAFHASSGLLVGGELSFVHFDDGIWFGVYTDVLYDQGMHRTRFSIGPEVGLGPFGVDFGYVTELGASPQQGWRVRGLLSAVFITAYAGPGRLHNGSQPVDFWEAGLLFKTPIKQF